MDKNTLAQQARRHVEALCCDIPDRRVGSAGNRMATDYVSRYFTDADWEVAQTPLAVIDWEGYGARLECDAEQRHGFAGHPHGFAETPPSAPQSFEVFPSPYSLGCDAEGELVAVDTVEALLRADLRDRIVLLHGPIAASQIVPKGYIFYSVEEHERIVAALEEGRPKALVCATGRDSATAGGVYPFPLFEDGNFDIPSVYMTDIEGLRLLPCAGHRERVVSDARRIPSTASNVIASRGSGRDGRIVVSAHVDAKVGTPGAIDNATGVAVVLLLAQEMGDYCGPYRIELAAFNGEDYYSAPGQAAYLRQNRGKFGEIVLNINIDGAGLKDGLSCFSAFGLTERLRSALDTVIRTNENIIEGLPWYQGDHSMFIQQGRPAVAVSSQLFIENMDSQQITHTPKDNPSIVSYERVAECAVGIGQLIMEL